MPKLFTRLGNLILADRTDPTDFIGVCEMCGARDELRPYGPNNENICFDCAMKDEPTTERKMRELMDKGSQ